MSTRTIQTDSTDNKLFSILMTVLLTGQSYLESLLAYLDGVNQKLAKYVKVAELFGAANFGYTPKTEIIENNKISVQLSQSGRVMDVIMISAFVIVGIFVVATIYNDIPDTGVNEADTSVDNFTRDVFDNFELFATVILLIIIVLVMFYVRQMDA